MMTWGEIEGTPMQIQNKSFYRIPSAPDREVAVDKIIHKQRLSKHNKLQLKSLYITPMLILLER